MLRKTKEKLEIKCKEVEFQSRITIYETIHTDTLELKSAIKISVFEIKMLVIGFKQQIGENDTISNQKTGQQKEVQTKAWSEKKSVK